MVCLIRKGVKLKRILAKISVFLDWYVDQLWKEEQVSLNTAALDLERQKSVSQWEATA